MEAIPKLYSCMCQSHISICYSYNSWNIFFQKPFSKIKYARRTETEPSKQWIGNVLTVCEEGVWVSVCLCLCADISTAQLRSSIFSLCRWVWQLRLSFKFSRHSIFYIQIVWNISALSNETDFRDHKSIWDSQLWIKMFFSVSGYKLSD